MNALAYIHTGTRNAQADLWLSYQQQQQVILSHCKRHGIKLLHIFHELNNSFSEDNAWTQLDYFLRKNKNQVEVVILMSIDQLGEEPDDIANKILFLKEIYGVKVHCLDEQFVLQIVQLINGVKSLDVIKKQISELLLKYLITFRSKRVSFTIQGMADFCAMDPGFLLQSYETYRDLYQQNLSLKSCDAFLFCIDPGQYLSLVECTLSMLMSASLVN